MYHASRVPHSNWFLVAQSLAPMSCSNEIFQMEQDGNVENWLTLKAQKALSLSIMLSGHF